MAVGVSLATIIKWRKNDYKKEVWMVGRKENKILFEEWFWEKEELEESV